VGEGAELGVRPPFAYSFFAVIFVAAVAAAVAREEGAVALPRPAPPPLPAPRAAAVAQHCTSDSVVQRCSRHGTPHSAV